MARHVAVLTDHLVATRSPIPFYYCLFLSPSLRFIFQGNGGGGQRERVREREKKGWLTIERRCRFENRTE